MEIQYPDSSLISKVKYNFDTLELIVYFKKYYIEFLIYEDVPESIATVFMLSHSVGRYYLQNIKKSFNTKKQNAMADRIIKIKIDVKKINKDWLHVGEKGVYLNATVLFNEEQDRYGNNGMIVQDVPNDVYKADKTQKGEILGNSKVFGNTPKNNEANPGTETGKLSSSVDTDDLPF